MDSENGPDQGSGGRLHDQSLIRGRHKRDNDTQQLDQTSVYGSCNVDLLVYAILPYGPPEVVLILSSRQRESQGALMSDSRTTRTNADERC